MNRFIALFGLALLACSSLADVYLHNPRGSNNRNCRNDNNDRRRNGNRLFDSQNNDKGGYSCPRAYPFQRDNNNDVAVVNEKGALVSSSSDRHIDTETFFYYAGTDVHIEWTTQHGCGTNENIDCRMIFQYMCDTDAPAGSSEYLSELITNKNLRDGTPIKNDDGNNVNDEATGTIPENINDDDCDGNGNINPADCSLDGRYGYQESHSYYKWCKNRQRNFGLFTADQLPVDKNSRNRAINTRQNPGGTRRGLECPEERDYYPYWHPSPWKDIAVGVKPSKINECKELVKQSQNVVDKCYCKTNINTANQPTNQGDCNGVGEWTCEGKWNLPVPECFGMPYTRDNHLGNSLGGYTLSYNWTLPSPPQGSNSMRCVLRLRYNASTGDFPQDIDSDYNCDPNNGACVRSPVYDRDNQNREPFTYVQLVGDAPNERLKLSLAVNTDQFARTFQDRTYAFDIRTVPDEIKSQCPKKIHNLNVRGKRGNIVQTYPSVEYDFSPQDVFVEQKDCIHFQWIGSDYNPNRQPNNAEGGPYNPNNPNEAKADRSNLVQVEHLSHNLAIHVNNLTNPFFVKSNGRVDEPAARKFAFLDQDKNLEDDCDTFTALKSRNQNDRQARERDPLNCAKLNAVKTPYFKGDVVPVRAKTGSYKFISTRNNNFSNRSMKLKIDVGKCTFNCGDELSSGQVAGIVLGTLFGSAALGFIGFKYMSIRHPDKLTSVRAAAATASAAASAKVATAKARVPTTKAVEKKKTPPPV